MHSHLTDAFFDHVAQCLASVPGVKSPLRREPPEQTSLDWEEVMGPYRLCEDPHAEILAWPASGGVMALSVAGEDSEVMELEDYVSWVESERGTPVDMLADSDRLTAALITDPEIDEEAMLAHWSSARRQWHLTWIVTPADREDAETAGRIGSDHDPEKERAALIKALLDWVGS